VIEISNNDTTEIDGTLLRSIGRAQPASLTSDLLIKRGVPSAWSDQRRLFDSLR